MSNTLSNYLHNIYGFYKKLNDTEEEQSLTDVLNSFAQISEEYKDITNINKKHYSNINYYDCSKEEQEEFSKDILSKLKTLVINSIYNKSGNLWTWPDILSLMADKEYKKTEKGKRKVIYPVTSLDRPIGDVGYTIWNGFQIIDLDIKNAELAKNLKPCIFNTLSKYSWFLGICISASGKSLHVWTKISPITTNNEDCKIEYLINFRHKYSYIYITLLQYADKFGYTKDDIINFIDMAMCKPQQGSFISSDIPMVNTNFYNLRLDINFEQAFTNGIESINWISHPDLKLIFRKLEWFTRQTTSKKNNVEIDNFSNINNVKLNKNKKIHYKHAQRWQLANTLTSLYGEEAALKVMNIICEGTPYNELKGDVKTAAIHDKPISIWAVNELNKNHGFNIKIKENIENVNKEIENINKRIQETEDKSIDPTKILNDNVQKTVLYMTKDQYLSDIKDQIISNLSKITLLEAGAGYGKTEMIKSLKDKTLLILPFTSTIKAKVESSAVTKDWLYFYGTKRPTLEELLGDKNMAMTIDKFSKLNIMELDEANFKYIVIDESHLLFTSSYREVMSPTIQRLANCKAKIIMMTGTPTGEILFFPGVKYIKVLKEDYRIKDVQIHMCYAKEEKLIEMCQSMADDIINGKKILYPTNNGNLYFEQIKGFLQQILNERGYDKPLRAFYYKKSNYGDESMISIDVDKSIGNNDLIVCTNYLSVGVDICDRFPFVVYFSQLWIPQDIEQFSNRLRNNDLYIKIFLERNDNNGHAINYNDTAKLDLSFNNAELLFVRDMIRICNDMLERNDEESKYNPLISSILSTNKYLKYDENECKYFVDETTYKLKIFEERYSEYSKQLNVLINDLKYYGYTINIINHNEVLPDENIEVFEEIFKNCKLHHLSEQTVKTFKFLNHINDENIDIYKEIMSGGYGIFKDDEYKERREENNIYAEDLEIILKNLPIYLTLYKFYDPATIITIFEYCMNKKSGRINYAQLERIRRFIIIEENRRKKKIDFPIYKFIIEAQKFAKEHEYTTKNELTVWMANYAAKIANIVKDVVITDKEFFEEIFELITELFKVVVEVKKSTKSEAVHIQPFKLLWERKINTSDLFGGSLFTKEFFLQDLLDNMKPVEDDLENEYDNVSQTELPHTNKMTIDDVKDELPSVVHNQYNYYDYSMMDGSNDRFMRKQRNTSSLNDNIFTQINKNDDITTTTTGYGNQLFDDV